jgi:metal-responsive CopG/Arc/MetJ family transcriptional regulator
MKTKAHLVFPEEILNAVDEVAGKRKRSLFIVEATQEKLEKERFLRALERTKGAWTTNRHSELRTKRDLERYLREKRRSYEKRVKRLIRE